MKRTLAELESYVERLSSSFQERYRHANASQRDQLLEELNSYPPSTPPDAALRGVRLWIEGHLPASRRRKRTDDYPRVTLKCMTRYLEPTATRPSRPPGMPEKVKPSRVRAPAATRMPGAPPRRPDGRLDLTSTPRLWWDGMAGENHILVRHDAPGNGMCNRILDWIGRYRVYADIKESMQRFVILPHTLLRYAEGCHVRCALYRDTRHGNQVDEAFGASMLLATGRRVAYVAPEASVFEVTVHCGRRAMEEYVLGDRGHYTDACKEPVWGAPPQVSGLQACVHAWATPVAKEVILWALCEEHWPGVPTDDVHMSFWKRADGVEKAARDFWAHLAPRTVAGGGRPMLSVDWGERAAEGHLFAHPPAHWFDVLQDASYAARRLHHAQSEEVDIPVGGGLCLALVRCWATEERPRELDADRCLPYAIVHVTSGAWMRASDDAIQQDQLRRMHRFVGMAEAVQDTFLHGTYASTLHRERGDLGVPVTLACDERMCAYASCMQAYIREQRGAEMTIQACHRMPTHHTGCRHLSFLCFDVASDAAPSMEDWYAQLFSHYVSGSAWSSEAKSQFGSLRDSLTPGTLVYQSAWAFDVVVHSLRQKLHRCLVNSDEALILAVTSSAETPRPRKKAAHALDVQLECVLRIRMQTPVHDLAVITFTP